MDTKYVPDHANTLIHKIWTQNNSREHEQKIYEKWNAQTSKKFIRGFFLFVKNVFKVDCRLKVFKRTDPANTTSSPLFSEWPLAPFKFSFKSCSALSPASSNWIMYCCLHVAYSTNATNTEKMKQTKINPNDAVLAVLHNNCHIHYSLGVNHVEYTQNSCSSPVFHKQPSPWLLAWMIPRLWPSMHWMIGNTMLQTTWKTKEILVLRFTFLKSLQLFQSVNRQYWLTVVLHHLHSVLSFATSGSATWHIGLIYMLWIGWWET